MSELNIATEDLYQRDQGQELYGTVHGEEEEEVEERFSDDEDIYTDYVSHIVDNIVEQALDTSEFGKPGATSSRHDAFDQDVKLEFQPSIELRSLSESSYRVPSYLAVRSQIEITEKVSEEEQEHTCEQYDEIDKYAGVVVDQILGAAVEYAARYGAEGEGKKLGAKEEEQDEEEELSSTSSSTVAWPSIDTFNVETGMNKIYEFMDTWDYDEDWLYCVDFLTQQSDECSDYYKYEARWSIPTQMYPIPQATASIFFTIECSRVKPPHCPVSVTYVYEGTSFVHTLESAFSEDRLFEIVDAKLKFYQRLTF